jgi:hypothetical protein
LASGLTRNQDAIAENAEENGCFENRAAPGAVNNVDLASLIAAWPKLKKADRQFLAGWPSLSAAKRSALLAMPAAMKE